jgi:transposase
MRGEERQQTKLFSYVSPEHRIPPKHPIRAIRQVVNRALQALSPQFDALYAAGGRPSIPPEQLLRALLLQVLFTVRGETQLVERIDYDLMFGWFVGLELDDPVWDVTVFTKNRDRLPAGEIAQAFFQAVLAQARQRHVLSAEHFTVDGTLVRAWAGQKSFQRRGKRGRRPTEDDPGNPTVDFHGERRSLFGLSRCRTVPFVTCHGRMRRLNSGASSARRWDADSPGSNRGSCRVVAAADGPPRGRCGGRPPRCARARQRKPTAVGRHNVDEPPPAHCVPSSSAATIRRRADTEQGGTGQCQGET